MSKYKLNTKIFNKWSNNSAYILGFIMADGYLNVNANILAIVLSRKDEKHLKLINDLLNSTHPIRNYKTALNKKTNKRYNTSGLYIYSKDLTYSLKKLGISSKKSNREKFPNIPKKYINHFIRGYIDGDGCISLRKPSGQNKKYQLSLIILGNYTFLVKMKKILKIYTLVQTGTIRKIKNANISILEYSGNNSRYILEYVYKNTKNVTLLRKKRIFDKFCRLESIYRKNHSKNGRCLK